MLPEGLTKDFLASWVVFLVALPLCMGVALASGLPAASGILTGIIGGLIVASISGSPMQVSGPAAGLAVMVWQFVHQHGLDMLGPILILAGVLQFTAGRLNLGRWFRAMSPGVVYGMLAGIGVLLFVSQAYVMFDQMPRSNGVDNIVSLPGILQESTSGTHGQAGLIGLLTIVVMLLWSRFRPEKLKLIPGALLAVVAATAAAAIWKLPIHYVDVPQNLLNAIRLPSWPALANLRHGNFIAAALGMAFVASAETLLSAAAVDRIHNGQRTNFDKELSAQGVGNFLCGIVGALPMTGVIVRSSANVQAGAKTRASAVLHGLWLLAFVVALPSVLRMVPTASLAGVLLLTGIKLIDFKSIRTLASYGKIPLLIYAATLIGVVGEDLLTGVLIGLLLSVLKLLYKISQIDLRFELDEGNHRADLYMEGAATFLNIPEISAILERVPPSTELHVHTQRLMYIDHSCLDLLMNWEKQQASNGSRLVAEWDDLMARYERKSIDEAEMEASVS
jgi:MFS superfamily sulfate permease-like transporter